MDNDDDSFKERLFNRVNQQRYTPLPGQRAKCHHNRVGVVTDIEEHSNGLLFTGYNIHNPDKDWQSVDPKPPIQ